MNLGWTESIGFYRISLKIIEYFNLGSDGSDTHIIYGDTIINYHKIYSYIQTSCFCGNKIFIIAMI
jgi:hypothetical protein